MILRAALPKLNPTLPRDALDEAFRKVTVPQHPSLTPNNRAFHRMLVDGIAVECRRKDGSIGAEIVRLIDFDDPDTNDWLAVNQFVARTLPRCLMRLGNFTSVSVDSAVSCVKTVSETPETSFSLGIMVRIAGLEPARLAALPPQSSVSANSTISATRHKLKHQKLRTQADFGSLELGCVSHKNKAIPA